MQAKAFIHRWTDPDRRPAIIAAAVALLVYSVTLGGTLVFDDLGLLVSDPRMHEPWQWLHFAWESYNFGVDNLYRPLVSWSFALQLRLTGPTPWPMHAVNWLLHAGVSALVAEIARRLADRRTGYIAGLLFAVHPIHVEAVANLVGRAEEMCAIGVLGVIVLLLRRPITVGRAFAMAGCMLVALLSKEMGMLVPLLAVLLAASLRRGNAGPRELAVRGRTVADRIAGYFVPGPVPKEQSERRGAIALVLLFCWMAAGYLIFRERVLKFEWDRGFLDWVAQPMVRCGPVDRRLMPIVLIGRYTGLLILPIHQSFSYDARVIGYVVRFNDPYFYIGAMTVIGFLIAVGFAWWRREGALLFCLLASAVLYGVVGNIVTLIGTNFGERLIYLPSAFILIAVAILFARLPARAAVVLTAVIVSLGAVRSFTYARRWNDRLTFYEQSHIEQPKSAKITMLVADEYFRAGRLDAAAAVLAAGRETTPDYVEIWIQSAEVAMKQGKFDDADRFLQRADAIQRSVKTTSWRQKLDEMRAAAASRPSE